MSWDEADPKLLIGRTVVEADYEWVPDTDDELRLVLDDGTVFLIRGCWCNNDTGALDFATPTPNRL